MTTLEDIKRRSEYALSYGNGADPVAMRKQLEAIRDMASQEDMAINALKLLSDEVGKIPAFGDSIGEHTSKVLLGIANHRAKIALIKFAGR